MTTPDPDALKPFYEARAATYHSLDSTPSGRDRRVLELFPPDRKLRVCDLGCGSGRFLRAIKALGHDGVGVDISEKAVATACASGVRAIAGNPDTGEGLDRLGTGFDVVTALDVLEHTVHPREVLRRMQSLVSPDGCLILSVPNAGCLPARIVLALGLAPKRDSGLFDAGHLHWFTRASLGKLATECGWRPVAWRATPLPAVSRLGLWRTERLQLALLRPLANRWPGAWAYQLIVRLDRTT